MLLTSMLLTCTEPGSVPGQNCVDLEAAVCWLNWDWKGPQLNWVPADKETVKENREETNSHFNRHAIYLLQL